MDKIVRIHLAKVPYEISVDAQAELKKYLDDIRRKLDASLADEIIADIEVRITEILNERKIRRDGVITTKDIEAVKEQLGSPEQFVEADSDGEDIPAGTKSGEPRKLLRDPEGEILGGVASGLGIYFGVDPIFIRALFIVLTFASGLGVVLYLLFWLFVPAARSSSDKLQMSGQPVTVATLQRYRSTIQKRLGDGPSAAHTVVAQMASVIGGVLKVLLTAASVLLSLCVLVLLGLGSSLTFVYPLRQLFIGYDLDYIGLGLLWIIGLSLIGLLVALVMRLWGSHSSRLKVGAIACVAVLLLALAGAGASGLLIYNHFSDTYGNGKTTTALAINNLSLAVSPTKLEVLADKNLSLTYVVSNQPLHATYQAYPGLRKPDLSITSSQGVLSVSAADLSQAAPDCLGDVCHNIYLPIKVTLYGPAVASVSADNGALVWFTDDNFGNSLSVVATHNAQINLNNSYAVNLSLAASQASSIWAGSSSARQTTITLDATSSVDAPAASNLVVTAPKDCTQNGPLLFLNGYSGQATLNGQPQTADSLNQNNCVVNNDPPAFPLAPPRSSD